MTGRFYDQQTDTDEASSEISEHPGRIRDPVPVPRTGRERAFAGESNKRERIREHVPVLKFHTTSIGRWCEENEQESTWRTRRFLSPFLEQGLEYAGVAMFPTIPFPAIRNYGTRSRVLGPFRNAEEQYRDEVIPFPRITSSVNAGFSRPLQ
jgi:hypothetical protein